MIDKLVAKLYEKDPGAKVAYLTKFGSILYGTNTPESDTDYKGLYWPSIDSLIMNKIDRSVSFTTGDSHSRNNKDDTDAQLWPVHYWLNLLKKGDTNAIDLLFSMYAREGDVRITKDNKVIELLGKFYNNPVNLIDLKHNRGYVQYAYTQAKKYGIRGSRMNVLESVKKFFLNKIQKNDPRERVAQFFDELISLYYNASLCFEKETNGERCIWILGKGLTGSTTLQEAVDRLTAEYDKYGIRAEMAKRNEGIDWKAVSHAVRACLQIIELAETNFLKYPLKDAELIKSIKHGDMDWLTVVEPMIINLLEKAEKLINNLQDNNSLEENHAYILKSYYNQFIRKDLI